MSTSDFPRGSQQSNTGAIGAAASIIIPAILGVSHIITAIDMKIIGGSNTGEVFFATLQVISGASTVIYRQYMIIPSVSVGANDEATFSGDLIVPPNTAASIGLANHDTNCYEDLSVQWYDI
jgi:hypothetical protein